MKYDVITIGNATQDVYLFSKKFHIIRDKKAITGESECFAFGTKIELDHILFEVGGGATNAANTFHRQGLKVACMSRVGNDAVGEDIRRFLKKNTIGDLTIVDTTAHSAQSVFFLAPSGERTILVYRGASKQFAIGSNDLKKLRQAKWLYISSVAGNMPLLKQIALFAKKHHIKVAINPGKMEIAHRAALVPILKQIDVLLLNQEEAMMLLRSKTANDRALAAGLRRICPGIAVMTKGSGGSVAVLADRAFRVIIKPVKAVDTTGAGDAFGSGFVSGLIKYRGNVQKALILASQNSAAEVLHIGAKHGVLGKGIRVPNIHSRITSL